MTYKAHVFKSELGKHGCIACAMQSAGAPKKGIQIHNGVGPHCPVGRL